MADIQAPSGEMPAYLRTYKSYVAVLSQRNTDAPVATVMENTLGGDVVWARLGTGNYTGTLEGAFPPEKLFIFTGSYNGADCSFGAYPDNSPNGVFVEVMKIDNSGQHYADSFDLAIEIRVYQ